MALQQPFSKRNRYSQAKEITIREGAPESLRYFILETARGFGFGPSFLRTVVCLTLRVPPNRYNWTPDPDIWDEVQDLTYRCDWFKVYDIIEQLYQSIAKEDSEYGRDDATLFGEALNEFFVAEGIGWQLIDGQIVSRGNEGFESVVTQAAATLEASERPTAASHIHEALQDLSRRPHADLTGAIHHAMGSLECVARDVIGNEKATLGEIIKRHPDLLPTPLDKALSQVWGYASNEARHVSEGRGPSHEEAELVVGLSAALATYLCRKTI